MVDHKFYFATKARRHKEKNEVFFETLCLRVFVVETFSLSTWELLKNIRMLIVQDVLK